MGMLGWLMFREKVRWVTLPFIGLSVLGLFLITGASLTDFHLGVGEVAAIICMLGFDVGYLMSRYHRPVFNNYQNTTILLLLGWIPLFIISLALGEPLALAHVSAVAWIGLALSVVLNVVSLVAINYIFAHLKAYVAGNILLLEGVFALVVGLMFYGEVPAPLELAGAVIILGCAYVISALDAHSTPRIEELT
ncbi:MAG: hypothetical protein JWN01_938 [Patescibacteria group bacterium]|nr:hypothetical protein [Patescibacteria group bacterium]